MGEDHPETFNTIECLGILYVEMKRYEEAEGLLKEALVGYRRIFGEDHEHTKRCLGWIEESIENKVD